jgi:hypothetical protein
VVRDNLAGDGPALFIVAAARFGTSLLYKRLCLHPEAAWIFQPGHAAHQACRRWPC